MTTPDAGRTGGGSARTQQESIGELLGDLSRDVGTLVRQELALARAELSEEARRARTGVRLLGGAALALALTALFLSLAVAWALSVRWNPGWAALVVALGWAAAALILWQRAARLLPTRSGGLLGRDDGQDLGVKERS